jgi:hypothetical protein
VPPFWHAARKTQIAKRNPMLENSNGLNMYLLAAGCNNLVARQLAFKRAESAVSENNRIN